MKTKTQREQIDAERRAHNHKIETMRSQYAPSRDINSEYQQHQKRVAKILGDDEQGIIGTGFRNA